MATLVLSTIGNALGGPVGSAIGALIGQSIDQELLAPVKKGPRVGDLTVQTSSYGTQIPRIYGTMRVAGSVVMGADDDRAVIGNARRDLSRPASRNDADHRQLCTQRPREEIRLAFDDGHPTTYFWIHLTLAVVSFVLGTVIGVIGLRGVRALRRTS